MTYSIAALDEKTGAFGLAVSSSSPAVAARCAHVRASVGAVGTQNITDPRLGPRGLDMMASGASAKEAIEILKATHEHIAFRQLIAIDGKGRTAAFSGANVLGKNAYALAQGAVSAGNLLAGEHVPQAVLDGFAKATGPFPERIVKAMRAGLDAGGEEGPLHSVGLLVVDKVSWPVVDLRVDWHDDPIGELERLWKVYEPQMDAYVTRALNPSAAPSFGVPGDK